MKNPFRNLGIRMACLGNKTASAHSEDEGERQAARKVPEPDRREGAFDEHMMRQEQIRLARAQRERMPGGRLPSGADASVVKKKWRALMIQAKAETDSSDYSTGDYSRSSTNSPVAVGSGVKKDLQRDSLHLDGLHPDPVAMTDDLSWMSASRKATERERRPRARQ